VVLYADWKGFESLFVQIIPLVTMPLAAAGSVMAGSMASSANGLDPVLANVLLRDLAESVFRSLASCTQSMLSFLAMARHFLNGL